jgi:predicted secreted protein
MRSLKTLLPALTLAMIVPTGPLTADKEKPAEKKGPGVVVVLEKGKEAKAELKKGETLKVKLRIQGGVPFTWKVVKNDDKVLKAAGKTTTEAIKGEKPRPGGPRLLVFTFTAASAGTSKVEFAYQSFVAKDAKPTKTFTVEVTVK